MNRLLADRLAVSLWLSCTAAGVVAAPLAGEARWAIISWAGGGVIAVIAAHVRSRRGE